MWHSPRSTRQDLGPVCHIEARRHRSRPRDRTSDGDSAQRRRRRHQRRWDRNGNTIRAAGGRQPQRRTSKLMNIPGELIPIVLFICIAAMVIGVPLVKAFAKRIENQPRDLRLPPDVTMRLERMENAIDAIAVEVERISEGQRFTTKLLSERADKAAENSIPERAS